MELIDKQRMGGRAGFGSCLCGHKGLQAADRCHMFLMRPACSIDQKLHDIFAVPQKQNDENVLFTPQVYP